MTRSIAAIALFGLCLLAAGCDLVGHAETQRAEAAPTEVAATPTVATTPRETAPEPDPGAARLHDKSFDDIKFDIEPDAPFERSMLTREIEELSGKRIKIRGWILPTAQKRGIKQFVLVRDNQECCFGPGAALYDCILVDMLPGESAEFSIYSVAVSGEFRVEEFQGPDGRPLAIYQMRGEKVE